ncbi:hypothetical protein [Streptomyces sp. NPDC056600]|uniref:hypothetical protein n=1 Tax=Streptomyces sp. NPDC056600 TaxID=3345874 RepID=UPI00369432E5
MIEAVEELVRQLIEAAGTPSAEPARNPAGEARRHALAQLRVLVGIKLAVRHLEDRAAHTAASSGAGYPEIGQAVSMTRQGARRRWPGLITGGTDRPTDPSTPSTFRSS